MPGEKLRSRKGEVGVEGSGGGWRMPEDALGTRNLPVLGEVEEGRDQRAQEAMTVTVPPGGGGREVAVS